MFDINQWSTRILQHFVALSVLVSFLMYSPEEQPSALHCVATNDTEARGKYFCLESNASSSVDCNVFCKTGSDCPERRRTCDADEEPVYPLIDVCVNFHLPLLHIISAIVCVKLSCWSDYKVLYKVFRRLRILRFGTSVPWQVLRAAVGEEDVEKSAAVIADIRKLIEEDRYGFVVTLNSSRNRIMMVPFSPTLETFKREASRPDASGFTALHLACAAGNMDGVAHCFGMQTWVKKFFWESAQSI